MKKIDIERFFNTFGTEVDPGDDQQFDLYVPRKGEKAVMAEWGHAVQGPHGRVYLIRIRAGGDRGAVIRANTVVLRPDSLLCFDVWRSKTPTPELEQAGRVMNIDVTELRYPDIVALRLRCKALRVEEVNGTCLL